MARVYAGIGSNIQPQRHIASGLNALRRQFGALSISTVYRCRAVGFDGADFFNLAVGLDTDLSPHEVVAAFHAIEDEHGRQRGGERFADRTLDIDLLLYDDRVLEKDDLVLPRRDILKYAFVLKPLAELAPDTPHPVDGRTLAELWAAFPEPADDIQPV